MLHDFFLEVVESPDAIRSRADCRIAHARTIVVPCAVPVRIERHESKTEITFVDELLAVSTLAPSTLGCLQHPALLRARLFYHDLLSVLLGRFGMDCTWPGLAACSKYLSWML